MMALFGFVTSESPLFFFEKRNGDDDGAEGGGGGEGSIHAKTATRAVARQQ